MSKTLILLVGGDLIGAILLLVGVGQIGKILARHFEFVVPFGPTPFDGTNLGVGILKIAIFTSVLVLVTYLVELYDARRSMSRKMLPVRIFLSLLISFISLSVLYSLLPQFTLGQGFVILALPIFGIMQLLWHRYVPSLLRLPGVVQRVLILGVGPLALSLEKSMENINHNYVLAGFIQPADEVITVPRFEILAPLDRLLETAIKEDVSKIFISLSERRGVLPVKELLQARFIGIEVVDAAGFHEELTGTLLVENVNPGWFIYSHGFGINPLMRVAKRVNDIILASIGIILTTPLMPFIALAIKLDSPGQILFSQARVGAKERPFKLYKFRTMRMDAESLTGAVWAQVNDPRITRIGRFLRKSRLDELPQLFNVLNGDMALVGPRPERPEFVEQLKQKIPYYSKRHVLKPGVTGWAQVKYPYGASVEDAHEKLKYDLYYVKNHSCLLDVQIILETVKVVLFGRGGR